MKQVDEATVLEYKTCASWEATVRREILNADNFYLGATVVGECGVYEFSKPNPGAHVVWVFIKPDGKTKRTYLGRIYTGKFGWGKNHKGNKSKWHDAFKGFWMLLCEQEA